MKKEANFFPHFYNSRNDDKILKIRVKFNNAEGYGMFFMVCESMAESKEGYIDSLAIAELSLSYGIAMDKLKEFIDFCIEIELFYTDKNKIKSKTMDNYKKFRRERSESGYLGAIAKKEKSASATASAITSATDEPLARKEKKRKEKKINNNIIASGIKPDHVVFIDLFKENYLKATGTPYNATGVDFTIAHTLVEKFTLPVVKLKARILFDLCSNGGVWFTKNNGFASLTIKNLSHKWNELVKKDEEEQWQL